MEHPQGAPGTRVLSGMKRTTLKRRTNTESGTIRREGAEDPGHSPLSAPRMPRKLVIPAVLGIIGFLVIPGGVGAGAGMEAGAEEEAGRNSAAGGRPVLIAHRGLAQCFDISEVEWDTNTARIIYPPEHPYLENTIPSMEAAFACSADIVEFDLRLTKDKELAVFHDYLLEYRTDGSGLVSEHTMEELRTLDVGYGYTADAGLSYPFRGTGIGLLPSLDDVLSSFPTQAFLIHVRDGGAETASILAERFARMTPERLSRITMYGDETTLRILRERWPEMKMLISSDMKKGRIQYLFFGWTGRVPEILLNAEIHLPLRYAKLLWGWPDRFMERMEEAGVFFVLVDGEGSWSEGFDTEEDIARIPPGFRGGIWTERIDIVGPLYDGKDR